MEKPAEQLGVQHLPRSQVSEIATHLDAQVRAFRERLLDAAPYTFVAIKVREGGRIVSVHGLG